MTATAAFSPIKPRVRGFICITAHPIGCAKNVDEQINYVAGQGLISDFPKRVLVIGASTGYGLASRIVSAFGGGAGTLGVFFEKPSLEGKPASAGWYNSKAFEKRATEKGLYAKSINGDAFSNEIKEQTINAIKSDLGKVDLVVYSLASPRRIHPDTGTIHNSALKPIGKSFTAKTLDTDKEVVKEISIEPASQAEIDDTIAVMGGDDWERWIDALLKADVLEKGATAVSYSYIGPEVTWAIYRDGTIGKAKADLERACKQIEQKLKPAGGRAYVSINKALVTQASSAIPVVPLYVSLLYKIMKEKGLHEGCIEQMYRLFGAQLYGGHTPTLDSGNRIRIDDREMSNPVQEAVKDLWPTVTTENLHAVSDFAGYRSEFLKLFGFGLSSVDYEAGVNPEA
jgi:enoyl-[acyl-carrier protein] reductase / trans-2-enoyl-CoA reductase (NAD+)